MGALPVQGSTAGADSTNSMARLFVFLLIHRSFLRHLIGIENAPSLMTL